MKSLIQLSYLYRLRSTDPMKIGSYWTLGCIIYQLNQIIYQYLISNSLLNWSHHASFGAIITLLGPLLSRIMQQGDRDAPATIGKLRNYTFSDVEYKCVVIYLDYIFI